MPPALRNLAVTADALALAVDAPPPPSARRPKPEPKAPEEFVALRDVDPTIIQEIRYVTPHNFVGEPSTATRSRCASSTEARRRRRSHKAQRALLRQGYSLKVYDCYRPQRAVDQFVRWAEDLDDQAMKARVLPAGRQDAAVRGRLHRGEVRAQPRLERST